MLRRFIFQNTLNTRDLGGYPIASGGHTRYGSFIRSDAPANLTDNEVGKLYKYNITTILDLRGPEEIKRTPSFFADKKGFNYYNYPLYGNGRLTEKENDIADSYLAMLQDYKLVYSIMKLFANTESGILFHCTAGKDRTGIISALLLALAGVSMPDILVDYQISYTYIYSIICKLRKDEPSLPAWAGQSKPEYLADFFTKFLNKYHSVEGYLSYIGLTDCDILNIKNKLIFS